MKFMKTIQSNDELEVKNLTKIFNDKNNNLIVFKDVNLSFKSGEINFICGKSGSGKTTFLSIIGGLSLPTTGDIYFNDEKYFSSNDKVQKLDKFRNDYVSFVFQDFNLINDFSALDNLLVLKAPKEDALNILKIIGLGDKENIKAKFLSGGEKQRLAIGRALIKNSKIIILDEPTANLDIDNSTKVFNLIKRIAKDRIIIVASHDYEIINKYADRYFVFEENSLVESKINSHKITKFDNFNLDSAEFFNFIVEIIKNKPRKLEVENDNDLKEYIVNYDNLYEFLKNTFLPYANKDISIKLIESDEELKLEKGKGKEENGLSIKIWLKYIASIFKSRTFLIFTSFLCLLLSSLFCGAIYSILNFDLADALNRAYTSSEIEYVPVKKEEYNNNLMNFTSVSTGETLLKELDNKDINNYRVFDATINKDEEIYLIVLDDGIEFSHINIEPKDNEVILTSFEKAQLFAIPSGEIQISKFNLNFNASFTYLDDYVNPEIAKAYNENNLSAYQKDIINNKYKVGFISFDFLISEFEKETSYFDYAPFIDEKIQMVESKAVVNYRKNGEYNLIVGSNQISNNEVLISKGFAESNIKRYFNYGDDFSTLIDKELINFDITKSANKVNYLNNLNMSEISDKFIIKGIVDSNDFENFIVLSEDLRGNYSKNHINYSSEVRVDLGLKSLKELSSTRSFTLTTDSTTLIYNFYDFINGPFYGAIMVFLILFLFLISFLGLNLFRILYNDKIKEFFVLIIVGIKKDKLISSLIVLCGVILICGTLFGSVLSCLTLVGINCILRSQDLMNLNYNLLSFDWTILLLNLAILIGTLLISSLIIYKKLNKNDYSNEIKKFSN